MGDSIRQLTTIRFDHSLHNILQRFHLHEDNIESKLHHREKLMQWNQKKKKNVGKNIRGKFNVDYEFISGEYSWLKYIYRGAYLGIFISTTKRAEKHYLLRKLAAAAPYRCHVGTLKQQKHSRTI